VKVKLAAFLLCKDFIADQSGGGGVSLIGIIQGITVHTFPVTFNFVIYFGIRKLEGTHSVRIMARKPNGEELQIAIIEPYVSKDSSPVHHFLHRVGMAVEQDGEYNFQGYLDGALIGEATLPVVKLSG
jgi:hypothetical protein